MADSTLVHLPDGSSEELSLPNPPRASKLLKLPGLIDAHVHFRTPGAEHKENLLTGSWAAVRGGFTTIFDMPNTNPATISLERLLDKKALIDRQLVEAGVPLRYELFLGADRHHLGEIPRCKGQAIALKIYMGSSTGELLMADPADLDQAFRVAAENDMVVAVHAEDEELIKANHKRLFVEGGSPSLHSVIRETRAADIAVNQAIELAAKHGARLFILHMSCASELDLVRQAKKSGIKVYAEVAPHHLFMSTEDYALLGTRAQMNPPLRSPEDQAALWEGIADGTVDSVGTDHAPHTIQEKSQAFGKAPSGVPGLETSLPLMYTAHLEGRLSLDRLLDLMHHNVAKIYDLPPNDDWVIIDTESEFPVDEKKLMTRCAWSPFAGRVLKGWPVYVQVNGKRFSFQQEETLCKTS